MMEDRLSKLGPGNNIYQRWITKCNVVSFLPSETVPNDRTMGPIVADSFHRAGVGYPLTRMVKASDSVVLRSSTYDITVSTCEILFAAMLRRKAEPVTMPQ